MRVIFVVIVFYSFQLCAQTNIIRPLIKLGYHQTYLNNLNVAEIELGAGAQFNDYISTQINFRGSQQRVLNDPSENFQIATISIEPSYRVLGKKSIFSPVFAYDAGIEIVNNGKNKFINLDNYVYYSYYQEPYSQYNRGVFFGKAKILLSIQWKQLDFLIGASFDSYIFRFYELEPFGPQSNYSEDNKYTIEKTFIDSVFGFGFETSIKYTFPMKKQQAKKTVE